MNISQHATDEQLIANLYGLSPDDLHIQSCSLCRGKLAEMQASRASLESQSSPDDFSFEQLAAQRRAIYAKLSKPQPWWAFMPVRRVAAVAAAVITLSGSVLVYQQYHAHDGRSDVSDVQLAQDVSQMSSDTEAQTTEPLQALFD